MNRGNPHLSAFMLTVLLGAPAVATGAPAGGGTLPGGAAIAPASAVVSTADFLALQLPPVYRVAAAAGLALLLWLVFPLPVGLLCRAHLVGQPGLTPDERLQIYQRWQHRVQWTAGIGAFATLIILGLLAPTIKVATRSLDVALGWWLWAWCKAVMNYTSIPMYAQTEVKWQQPTPREARRSLLRTFLAPLVFVPIFVLTDPRTYALTSSQHPLFFGGMLALLGLTLLAGIVPMLWRARRPRPRRAPPTRGSGRSGSASRHPPRAGGTGSARTGGAGANNPGEPGA
ncbi:MAG TPA: hypothetical protein VK689_02700 [Armatimonadota bacterium]|nr:hypothetical protein [Armatimonadota bacterium]